MKITAGIDDFQSYHIRSKDITDNATQSCKEGAQLSSSEPSPDIKLIQKVNITVLKLMESAGMLYRAIDGGALQGKGIAVATYSMANSPSPFQNVPNMTSTGMAGAGVGGSQLPMPDADLGELVVTLVESMNEALHAISEANGPDMTSNIISHEIKKGLDQLKKIILSGVKVHENIHAVIDEMGDLGIKVGHDGSLSIDQQILTEKISSSAVEAARIMKTVASTIFESLPFCIDPQSGSLIYSRRKLDENGEGNASKVLAAFEEELEKERSRLDSRLGIAERLIAYSGKLIDDLKPLSEALSAEQ